WVSSYAATSPASPAPRTRTFFGDAVCGNACGVKLQLRSGANCADAARTPSFKNSRRSIGMGIAPPYGNLMSLIQPELYSGRWGMGSRPPFHECASTSRIRLDANAIIDRRSNPLFTAQVTFCRLHRHVA